MLDEAREVRGLYYAENVFGGVREVGLLEWARGVESGGRWSIRAELLDLATWLREPFGSRAHRIDVSTVFLGLDHNFSGVGPPVLYETMIFGGPRDGYQDRYETRDDAIAGHAVAKKLARAQEKGD